MSLEVCARDLPPQPMLWRSSRPCDRRSSDVDMYIWHPILLHHSCNFKIARARHPHARQHYFWRSYGWIGRWRTNSSISWINWYKRGTLEHGVFPTYGGLYTKGVYSFPWSFLLCLLWWVEPATLYILLVSLSYRFFKHSLSFVYIYLAHNSWRHSPLSKHSCFVCAWKTVVCLLRSTLKSIPLP